MSKNINRIKNIYNEYLSQHFLKIMFCNGIMLPVCWSHQFITALIYLLKGEILFCWKGIYIYKICLCRYFIIVTWVSYFFLLDNILGVLYCETHGSLVGGGLRNLLEMGNEMCLYSMLWLKSKKNEQFLSFPFILLH